MPPVKPSQRPSHGCHIVGTADREEMGFDFLQLYALSEDLHWWSIRRGDERDRAVPTATAGQRPGLPVDGRKPPARQVRVAVVALASWRPEWRVGFVAGRQEGERSIEDGRFNACEWDSTRHSATAGRAKRPGSTVAQMQKTVASAGP